MDASASWKRGCRRRLSSARRYGVVVKGKPDTLASPHAIRLRAEARERADKALELRRQGLTYDQIAKKLGYAGRQGARKAIHSGLQGIPRANAELLRKDMVERLDEMYSVAWSCIADGDADIKLKAIQTVLRVMERTSKLIGLDAPQVTLIESLSRLSEQELHTRARDVAIALLQQAPGTEPEQQEFNTGVEETE